MVFPVLIRGTGEIEDSDQYLVYLTVLFGSFLLMGPMMWLADKREYTVRVLSGMVGLFIISFVLMMSATDLLMIAGALFVFFMAFNLMEVTLPAQISRHSPAGTRGTAMGIYSTSQFAGGFFGGLVGGWILQYWDISLLMLVNILICLFWLGLFFTMKTPANLSGKTLYFSGEEKRSDTELLDVLSSIAGVEDAVLLRDTLSHQRVKGSSGPAAVRIAHLKVDNDQFDEQRLEECGIVRVE